MILTIKNLKQQKYLWLPTWTELSNYYAYFTTEEKAQAWLDKHNNGLGGNLEVAKIVVA